MKTIVNGGSSKKPYIITFFHIIGFFTKNILVFILLLFLAFNYNPLLTKWLLYKMGFTGVDLLDILAELDKHDAKIEELKLQISEVKTSLEEEKVKKGLLDPVPQSWYNSTTLFSCVAITAVVGLGVYLMIDPTTFLSDWSYFSNTPDLNEMLAESSKILQMGLEKLESRVLNLEIKLKLLLHALGRKPQV